MKTAHQFVKIYCLIIAFILWIFPIILSESVIAEEALTWEDCVNEALVNHPDLLSAKEKIIQSRADKNISRSGIFPQISGQAKGGRTRTETGSETDTYSYDISGQQLLFDGFKTSADINAAVKSFNAQEYNYLVASSDIRLNLRTAFSVLLRAQQLISLTEEIAKRRKENLDLVRIRYEAGREHNGAVLTAEADLSQAEFEVAQAKRNLSLAQQGLTKELGREEKIPVQVIGDFTVSEMYDLAPDFAALADNTPFLNELIAKKDSARFSVNSAKADFFPQVYLNSSLGKSQSDWPPERETWSAGLTVSVPIFEGGNKIASVEKAKSQLAQAQADERSGRDMIIYTLEKTWKDLRDAIEMVDVKKKFFDAASERAKIANAQYSSGLITFDDWIIIENNLVSARKAHLDAQENLLIAESYWIQAKGGVLEYVRK